MDLRIRPKKFHIWRSNCQAKKKNENQAKTNAFENPAKNRPKETYFENPKIVFFESQAKKNLNRKTGQKEPILRVLKNCVTLKDSSFKKANALTATPRGFYDFFYHN